MRSPHHHRDRLLRIGLLAGALSATALSGGCSEQEGSTYEAPEVMLRQRPFTGPGQIAQGLGANGRALIFVERESLPGRPKVTFDPAWTFELSVVDPTGDAIALDPTPVVPRAWSTDSGVEVVGGFNATIEGTYLITVSSPNCPPRTASMVVLPIN